MGLVAKDEGDPFPHHFLPQNNFKKLLNYLNPVFFIPKAEVRTTVIILFLITIQMSDLSNQDHQKIYRSLSFLDLILQRNANRRFI